MSACFLAQMNVVAQFLRKVLYVGFFALLLDNFQALADIVFRSFAGLDLRAGAAPFGPDQLMRPGFVAETGFAASWPLLEAAGDLIDFTALFENFVTIIVRLMAWAIVLLAFFVLSVQLFITIIEFKLTTLAGFVPGIAAGLISGAPQLGAGAAAGTAIGVAGAVRAGPSLAGRTSAGFESGGLSGVSKATIGAAASSAAPRMTAPTRGA